MHHGPGKRKNGILINFPSDYHNHLITYGHNKNYFWISDMTYQDYLLISLSQSLYKDGTE